MIQFEVRIRIDRTVVVVTAALMNPDNWVHWTAYLERFEVMQA